MTESEPIIFVVDDDPAVLDSMRWLLESAKLRVQTFSSAESFLESYNPQQAGCLVLDIRMPGMCGLSLQQELNNRGITLPVIMVTGHGDIPLAVKAVKAGAIDFLEKPFSEQVLLGQIHRALEIDRANRSRRVGAVAVHSRISTLTPRERQVLDRIISGKLNKQIASDLGLSPKTVEIHRARLMKKMQASNVADLVNMVVSAGR